MCDQKSSPVLNISLSDSFFGDWGGGAPQDEDFFRSVDERINSKVAVGMKKAVALIVQKLSAVIHEKQKCSCPCQDPVRLRAIVDQQMDARIKELKETVGPKKPAVAAKAKKTARPPPDVVQLNLSAVSRKKSTKSRQPSAEVVAKRAESAQVEQKIANLTSQLDKKPPAQNEQPQIKRKLSEILDSKKKQKVEQRASDESDKLKKKALVTDHSEKGLRKNPDLAERRPHAPATADRKLQTPSAVERKNKIYKKYAQTPRTNLTSAETKLSSGAQQPERVTFGPSAPIPMITEKDLNRSRSNSTGSRGSKRSDRRSPFDSPSKFNTSQALNIRESSASNRSLRSSARQERFPIEITRRPLHTHTNSRESFSNYTQDTAFKMQAGAQVDETPIGFSMEVKGETEEKPSQKLKWQRERRPVSTRYDVFEDIYLESDPIDVSLRMRVNRGGLKTFVVRDYYTKSSNFFFDLKWKEPVMETAGSFAAGNVFQVGEVPTTPQLPSQQANGQSNQILLGGTCLGNIEQKPHSQNVDLENLSEEEHAKQTQQFTLSNCSSLQQKEFQLKNQILALPEEEESFGNHTPYKNYLDTNEISDDEGPTTPGHKSEPRNLLLKRGRASDGDDLQKDEHGALPKAKSRLESHEKLLESSELTKETPQFKVKEKEKSNVEILDQNPFFIDNYEDYDDTKDFYGLSQIELGIFGDRSSDNHEKIRIISKSHTQLYWLTLINEEEHDGKLFIEQQIPQGLHNFEDKINMLRSEQEFFQLVRDNAQLREFVFTYEGIINEEELEDIWSIYQIDEGSDVYRSLRDTLFTISFDASLNQKMYHIEHSVFYDLLAQENGVRHLAVLIQKICLFLDQMQKMQLIYGNITAESILIKFDEDQKKIEQIKFINFGAVIKLENATQMLIADKVDHFPPDVLRHFMEMRKFSRQSSEASAAADSKFRTSYASFDIFSLGMLVLQIIGGCPAQLPLPLKFRCKRRSGELFFDHPPFGSCPLAPDDHSIGQLIDAQEKHLSHLDSFMAKYDRHHLTRDPDFLRLLEKMLSRDTFVRPDANDILNDRFIRKWTKRS